MKQSFLDLSKGRVMSLDIIRGLAALSVFLSHLGDPSTRDWVFYKIVKSFHWFVNNFLWCNEGLHWGVIVFIVLSGFCIHMPTAKKGLNQINLPYYARRRFFRIYPVLFFAVILGMASFVVINSWPGEVGKNLAINLVGLSAVFPFETPLGNDILLTVIVECWLYAIYPWGLAYIRRTSWGHLFIIMSLIHVGNWLLLLFTNIEPTWIQRNLCCFLLYWWVGAFAAHIVFTKKKTHAPTARACLAVYVLYVVLCHVLTFKGAHAVKSLYLSLLTGYILVFLYGWERKSESTYRQWWPIRLFSSLGEKSYSLYVVHFPILTLLFWLLKQQGLVLTMGNYLFLLMVIFACTLCFYYAIERPFHRLAIESSNRTLGRRNSR